MNQIKKRLNHKGSWYGKILYILMIIAVIYSLFYYGFIKKDCGQDEDCFYESAKECKPAELISVQNGNYYYYAIKGERKDSCLVYVKLERVAPGVSIEQKTLFEGKDMDCKIPLNELEKVSFDELKGFVNYCHGSLKEAIYEQILTKLYGLIIQNLDEIILFE